VTEFSRLGIRRSNGRTFYPGECIIFPLEIINLIFKLLFRTILYIDETSHKAITTIINIKKTIGIIKIDLL